MRAAPTAAIASLRQRAGDQDRKQEVVERHPGDEAFHELEAHESADLDERELRRRDVPLGRRVTAGLRSCVSAGPALRRRRSRRSSRRSEAPSGSSRDRSRSGSRGAEANRGRRCGSRGNARRARRPRRYRRVGAPRGRTTRLRMTPTQCKPEALERAGSGAGSRSWWGEGSNLRRLSHLIYSQAPLAAWVPHLAPG